MVLWDAHTGNIRLLHAQTGCPHPERHRTFPSCILLHPSISSGVHGVEHHQALCRRLVPPAMQILEALLAVICRILQGLDVIENLQSGSRSLAEEANGPAIWGKEGV